MFKFKNRKGATSFLLVIVLSFFVVTMASIVLLQVSTTANAAQVQRQQTRAYYLVLAGMEVGTAAALMRGLDDSFPVLNHFRDNNFPGTYDEVLYFGPGGHPDLPDYRGSEIEITIRAVYQDGTPITGSSPTDTVWVEVYVRAWYYNFGEWDRIQADNNLRRQIGTPHAGRIRFNTNEPQWYIREIENPNISP